MRSVRTATWLLASTALVAVGCGDDTAETTSTTGQGGEGSGGDDAQGSTGTNTPTSSSSGAQSSSSGSPQGSSSASSGGEGGSGAGPGTGGEGGGTGGTGGGGDCGNGELDPGEECDGGEGCTDTCTIEIEPGCGNGVLEPDLDEDCDDGNENDLDGCQADCTVTPAVIECEVLAPIGGGGCEVDAGSNAKLLIGDVLLPYTVLKGGQVSVGTDGIISCVGCDCAGEEPGATVVTCPEGAISPGLINTHEHITYAQNNPYVDPSNERYEHRHQWRRGLDDHTEIPASNAADGAPRTAAVRWGELRFLLSGATSLVGSGTASGFLRNLDRADKEGLDVPNTHFEVFPLSDGDGDMLESGCGYPDIDSAQSIALDLAYLPHVSEGINDAARNEFVCVSGAPGEDLLTHHSSFIHGVGLDPVDYADMARDGTSLIWSPRSNIVLYGNTAQVTTAARAGVNIALGTDWIISGSMNMFRELTCASDLNDIYFDGYFSRRDLWRMVTDNAARSLGLEKQLGTLAAGLVGDIAIYDASDNADYAAVVDGAADAVHLVLRGGEPLYGDTSILDDLPDAPATCESPFDACMADKTICVQSEINSSYAALEGAAGQAYGPYFCGTPTNEPSCVPFRNQVVDGSNNYTGVPDGNDQDGDGIDDDDDNCPAVFNPIRPMDGGAQGDADDDDVGDACDPCPLMPNRTDCAGVDPADEDSDGIPNFFDNCPYDANTAQIDSDGDDKGNVCDQCPNDPNPGFGGVCAATIYDVKTGAIAGEITLSDVLVTACAEGAGFFLQHKEGDDAYDGPENSGLYVFDPDTECGSTVRVGDRLDIGGETSVFYDQIQLGFAEFSVVGQDSAPDPVVLTVAEASGTLPNAYEGVLARVEDVEVTDDAPPRGPGDSNPSGEYEVGGSLRIDNFVYRTLPIPAEGTEFSSITGVLAYKNGNQKMEPRDAADLAQ